MKQFQATRIDFADGLTDPILVPSTNARIVTFHKSVDPTAPIIARLFSP
jgi:hypothetical protein